MRRPESSKMSTLVSLGFCGHDGLLNDELKTPDFMRTSVADFGGYNMNGLCARKGSDTYPGSELHGGWTRAPIQGATHLKLHGFCTLIDFR